MTERSFRTEPAPLWTNHIWTVTGEKGDLSFEVGDQCPPELREKLGPMWGDGWLRSTTIDIHVSFMAGWRIKDEWQAGGFDEKIIYAKLEELYEEMI